MRFFAPQGFQLSSIPANWIQYLKELRHPTGELIALLEFRTPTAHNRQIDCLILSPSGVDLIEIKAKKGAVQGTVNGEWTVNGTPFNNKSRGRTENPYQQAEDTKRDFDEFIKKRFYWKDFPVYALVLVPDHHPHTVVEQHRLVYFANGIGELGKGKLRAYNKNHAVWTPEQQHQLISALNLTEVGVAQVRGRVEHPQNGRGIPHVEVRNHQGTVLSITDEQGQYSFITAHHATLELVFSPPTTRLEQQHRTIQVTEQETCIPPVQLFPVQAFEDVYRKLRAELLAEQKALGKQLEDRQKQLLDNQTQLEQQVQVSGQEQDLQVQQLRAEYEKHQKQLEQELLAHAQKVRETAGEDHQQLLEVLLGKLTHSLSEARQELQQQLHLAKQELQQARDELKRQELTQQVENQRELAQTVQLALAEVSRLEAQELNQVVQDGMQAGMHALALYRLHSSRVLPAPSVQEAIAVEVNTPVEHVNADVTSPGLGSHQTRKKPAWGAMLVVPLFLGAMATGYFMANPRVPTTPTSVVTPQGSTSQQEAVPPSSGTSDNAVTAPSVPEKQPTESTAGQTQPAQPQPPEPTKPESTTVLPEKSTDPSSKTPLKVTAKPANQVKPAAKEQKPKETRSTVTQVNASKADSGTSPQKPKVSNLPQTAPQNVAATGLPGEDVPETSSTTQSSGSTGLPGEALSADAQTLEGCSSDQPIKGNINLEGERIYHVPTGEFYEATRPEQCFATEQEAQQAGFRASKR